MGLTPSKLEAADAVKHTAANGCFVEEVRVESYPSTLSLLQLVLISDCPEMSGNCWGTPGAPHGNWL